jgi:hypothetical protein
VAAPIQTCQEARNQGLYLKAFVELASADGSGRLFVWLNLDIDVVSIGLAPICNYKPVMPIIKRLKLEREHSDYFSYREADELGNFANTKEFHLVCADGMWMWHYAIDAYYWPCGKENIFMIDSDNDRTVRAIKIMEILN